MLLVILPEYVTPSGFDISVELLDIIQWKIQWYVRQREYSTKILVSFAYLGFIVYTSRYSKKEKKILNDLWPEELVEPCFVFSFFVVFLFVYFILSCFIKIAG